MKFRIVALLAIALSPLAVSTAHAQSTTSTTPAQPWVIKLGAFFPSNGDVKNATGSTWFNAGAEYNLAPSTASTTPANGLVYLDYAGGSKTYRGVDVNADYVGLGVGGKISAQQTAHSALTPYAGVGLGCYLVHASGGGESKTDTNIGFKVDAGVQFSQFLLELGYTDPGNIHADGDSKNVGGITLDAGVKF